MHDKDLLLSSAHCHILMWQSVNLPNNKFIGFCIKFAHQHYHELYNGYSLKGSQILVCLLSENQKHIRIPCLFCTFFFMHFTLKDDCCQGPMAASSQKQCTIQPV